MESKTLIGKMETSNLPPADQVRREVKIRIEQVCLSDCKNYTTERVAFDRIFPENPALGACEAEVKLFKIEDDRITGELPSKVFFYGPEDSDMVLTFYCSPSLPNRARPFADGPVYVFALDAPSNATIEYDGEVRLFIDQAFVPNRGIVYVVMFGQDQYDFVVTTNPKPKSKQEWDPTLEHMIAS